VREYAPALVGEQNASEDGLDRERLEAWFTDAVPGAEPPLSYERIAGGRSNLTYSVADSAGGRWILRRPPLGTRLGSAHDMGREHRILTGLEGTDVPAPRPLALCSDESVTGAEFYVMELVDGLAVRSWSIARMRTRSGWLSAFT
jgi:aminoglycoside phosphotransferase (APT) family kinase protein